MRYMHLLSTDPRNLDGFEVASLPKPVGLVEDGLGNGFGNLRIYSSQSRILSGTLNLDHTCMLFENLIGWYRPPCSITSSTTGLLPLTDCMGSLTWEWFFTIINYFNQWTSQSHNTYLHSLISNSSVFHETSTTEMGGAAVELVVGLLLEFRRVDIVLK